LQFTGRANGALDMGPEEGGVNIYEATFNLTAQTKYWLGINLDGTNSNTYWVATETAYWPADLAAMVGLRGNERQVLNKLPSS
jgi:hypothetical protein